MSSSTKDRTFDHQKIESKWLKNWQETNLYQTPPIQKGDKKKYILDAFAYPSGSGLHVGHAEGYVGGDILARYWRMQGYKTIYPVGWDSFGLPAEGYAIKTGVHPHESTEKAIENFVKQIKFMGLSNDWNDEIASHRPEYYKWTQWFFELLYKNGLAYKKEALVNWDPVDKTVLANEQVLPDGTGERSGAKVEQKMMNQWFFRITDYIEDKVVESGANKGKLRRGLLNGLDDLNWPESSKIVQRNWIGKSLGAEIQFELENLVEKITVFTTRPDTLFGVTYLVLAPEHELVSKITTKEQQNEVEAYIKTTKKKSQLQRTDLNKDKTGVFTGAFGVHPLTNETVPIWIADYVLSTYGTGAVMAVPSHDERDFEFAKKMNLPFKQVIAPYHTTSDLKSDKPVIDRVVTSAIIKHWKEDKYLCLDWVKLKDWKSLVTGGVESGESFEEAVEREIKEESGYQNFKILRKLGGGYDTEFYAVPKDTNTYMKQHCFLVELVDDIKKEIGEEELEKHLPVWVEKDKVEDFLAFKNHKYFWNIYLNGDKPITEKEDVRLCNSGEFDKLTVEEGKKAITQKLIELKKGNFKTTYKLRDWLISRQRYWGSPIPIYYDKNGKENLIPEQDLPVKLPMDVEFEPTGKSPLTDHKGFHQEAQATLWGRGD
jgi:leucyl-tRNA synthetase